MKKLLITILLFLPALIKAQDAFTISGKIGHENQPAKAFLLYRDGKRTIVDSTGLVDGRFQFKGTIQEPTAARLILDHKGIGFANTAMSADMIMMFLHKGDIQINAADSLKHAVFPASAINVEYQKYQKTIAPVDQQRRQHYALYQNASQQQREDSTFKKAYNDENALLNKRYWDLQMAHVKAHPDSYVSLSLLKEASVPVIDVPVIEPLFNGLSERVRLSTNGKEFKAEIEKRKRLATGQLAPDFTQNDQFDHPVKLSEFRGKYVLVDFWASWCKPCRAENPELVKAFNQFKDKNFTIISVSLDRPGRKEDWLKAIEMDGMKWTHVSDLQFWDNAVAKLYGIKSVPQNFLLDQHGRIIAQDLRGDALSKKLAEIL